jgi:hypothetical protein
MQVAPLPEQNLAIWLASLIGLGGLVFFLSALVLGGVPRQTVFDALARLRRRQR